MTRRGRWALAGLAVALLAGFGLLFPTGTWLRQSSGLSSVSHQLSSLQAQNRSLRSQAKALDTNSYIAYLAHRDYGLVSPGQEAYVVLPTTTTTTAQRH
ncbi:MAG: septum formation initiator family protein [Acidimicrobiales bacterium]